MYCPRLEHFIVVSQPKENSGCFSRCCQMVNQPLFKTVNDMESSSWLQNISEKFARDEWPDECVRCKQDEDINHTSVREWSLKNHPENLKKHKNYYIVDVKVDTKCNAACQTCNSMSSSLLAKLNRTPVNTFEGLQSVESLEKNRIIQIDLIGGEPAVSSNVRHFLESGINEFNISTLRINSNGSVKLPGIERLLSKGVGIEITLSMDGTGSVFEYCRWPIKWGKFTDTLEYYKSLRDRYPNLKLALWTVHSALSIIDYPNVVKFSLTSRVPMHGSLIQHPDVLTLDKRNFLTQYASNMLNKSRRMKGSTNFNILASAKNDNSSDLREFIFNQDSLRGINFNDYYQNLGLWI